MDVTCLTSRPPSVILGYDGRCNVIVGVADDPLAISNRKRQVDLANLKHVFQAVIHFGFS